MTHQPNFIVILHFIVKSENDEFNYKKYYVALKANIEHKVMANNACIIFYGQKTFKAQH